jgi:RNA polymerase sigma factor (sigma-70 family)
MDQTNDALPDEILVVQSLQGDRKSLEGLVGRHYRFIYNVVLKMLSNKEDAADITQEVVIKLITKLDSFKHNSAFRTWLYKIIVNHVLNYRKSQSMKKRYTFRQFGEILDGAPDMEFSADDHYAADQV